jgi:type IV pilus assembly protein PilQ
MSLARVAGYGFAYEEAAGEAQPASVPGQNNQSAGSGQAGLPEVCGVRTDKGFAPCPVTVSFKNETFERAFNFVLFTSGLQARVDGTTVFVGPNVLVRSLGYQVSKVYRLNQIGPNQAAEYLANLGAQVTTTNTVARSESASYESKSTSKTTGSGSGSTYSSTYESGPRTLETYQKTSSFGSGSGPLVGLSATTDVRLSSITLFGESSVIAVAENYLRQLDLRQRQVALTVRILDVNLDNSSEIDNSFAFRYGSNFIVNDQGRLLAAFGKNLPAQSSSFDQFEETTQTSASTRSSGGSRNASSSRASSEGQSSSAGSSATTQASDSVADTYQLTDTYTTEELKKINDVLQKTSGTVVYKNDVTGKYETLPVPANDGYREATETNISNITNLISAITGRETSASRTNTSSNTRSDGSDASSGSSSQSGRSSNAQSDRSSNKNKSSTSRKRPNPGLNYPDSEFYDFLQAQIVSRSTKILASPTLILQEGDEPYSGSDSERISTDGKVGRSRTNEAFVRVGTQYVTAYAVRQDINGNNFCEPKFGNAGLTFGARVDKIDDNGFVTFSLSPEISAAIGTQQIDRCGIIYQINDRLLDTGKVRVRDGQTLILTGVISDEDRSVVTKWPILGDLPLVGQFFRRSSGDRRKSELVIMVTPRVIKDDQGGMYGYGYQPATNDARGFVYSGG